MQTAGDVTSIRVLLCLAEDRNDAISGMIFSLHSAFHLYSFHDRFPDRNSRGALIARGVEKFYKNFNGGS